MAATPEPVSSLARSKGEDDLRQFALAIGTYAAVVAGQHDVTEVYRLLSRGGHIDDARMAACLQQRQQAACQQEAGQVVHRKAQFMPVATEFALSVTAAGADAGIVDQDVEVSVVTLDRVRQTANIIQRREIGWVEGCLTASVVNGGQQTLGAGLIAAMYQHRCARQGKPLGNVSADAISRAGDQYRLVAHAHRGRLHFVSAACLTA